MGKYPNAPIREAVLDIRVAPRDDLVLDDLRSLAARTPDFPKIDEQFAINATLQMGAAASQSITPVKQGFVFQSPDQHRLFVAQGGGFSFSQLPPYDSWEVFAAKGKELWTTYKDMARPKAVTRLALRYVNRLEVPMPLPDFEEYLRIAPKIPEELPQGISHFFIQYQIPYPDIGAKAVINIGMIEPPANDILPILLDIDVFREHDVPQDESEIWNYFEDLRVTKNSIFEAAITKKMKARFSNG
jgi:uncharacterized protein (TIGR04255 family)